MFTDFIALVYIKLAIFCILYIGTIGFEKVEKNLNINKMVHHQNKVSIILPKIRLGGEMETEIA